MKAKRSRYKPEFKAQVAMAALQGDKTLAELSQQFKVHQTMISDWKRQLAENASSVFEKDRKSEAETTDVDALYRKIGKLEVERDFLASRPGLSLSSKGNR